MHVGKGVLNYEVEGFLKFLKISEKKCSKCTMSYQCDLLPAKIRF